MYANGLVFWTLLVSLCFVKTDMWYEAFDH